jgi:hypothetical protein
MHVNIRVDIRDNKILRVLPMYNTLLKEDWISDITRFSYDGFYEQRLSWPYKRCLLTKLLLPRTWIYIWNNLREDFYSLNFKNKINFFLGNFIDAETSIILKKLTNIYGNYNIYTNQVNYSSNNFRNSYLFNYKVLNNLYNNKIDNVLLIGLNLRINNPLLYERLKNLHRKNYIKLYNIGLNFNYGLNFNNSRSELKFFLEGRSFLNNLFLKNHNNLILIDNNLFNEKFNINNIKFFFNKYIGYKNYNLFALNILSTNLLIKEFNLIDSINNFKDKDYKFSNKLNIERNRSINYFINTDKFYLNKFYSKNLINIYQGQYSSNLLLPQIDKIDYLLPTVNIFEKNSIYINFFGYIQKVKFFKEINTPGPRSDWKILYYLFRLINNNNYIKKDNIKRFNLIQSFFKSYNFKINNILNNDYNIISNYSYKFNIINNLFFDINTNIFKSNQLLGLSLNMNKIFIKYKKSYINFN